ncbi:four-carbon acid sugar kinase family protein [Burkholderia sp. Ax-1719]|uniref:four-carbon acid sugar kinase family protein n=1 Tax=Burkholderia sp. Ax-1719 TaxID=2608334 RepID=UPI0014228901|nr:four-carbon acid sugar kinase family protein [Burkholderia sp. Ax-1719]NIE66363.1 four-carbon acid sugar kinase family protein [Burkholderia sp. Ax-1719]
MKLLIIADDLSGAADCAIGFANAGHRTVVTLDASGAQMESAPHDADVIAADTDTRRLTPADAAERTAQAFVALGHGRRLYKKIDSTLRGNWAAEVAGLQARAGLAIVAPAFPATGRTVRGGALLVHGVPLEQTDTWQLEHAGRHADMAAMLASAGLKSERFDAALLHNEPRALARRAALIAAEGPEGAQALIVDAQSAADLQALARATLELQSAFFWVGSGGLARELATLDAPRANAAEADDAGASAPGPILVLVGSLSAVGERQCAVLRERVALAELIVPPEVLRAGHAHAQWTRWGEEIGAILGTRQHADLLLRIGRDDAFDPAEGAQLSAMLAALVAPHFARLGGLIATGGETARAMLDAAGIGSLRLITEIEAGVAVARPHTQSHDTAHRPAVVTKAGAFGTDEALYAAWRHLRNIDDIRGTDRRTEHNPT